VSRGKSGRIVLEVDPALKRQLYIVLTAEEKTLKEWFVGQADRYIRRMTSPQFNLLPDGADATVDQTASR
jgi:hypothetical protein